MAPPKKHRAPPPKLLQPTCVELHRAGRITLHYTTSVSGPDAFVLHVPHHHASSVLRHLRVRDTRSDSALTAPTVTLPSPPDADTDAGGGGGDNGGAEEPLAQCLRSLIGRRVDLDYRPTDAAAREWSLCGVLVGLHAQSQPPPAPADNPGATLFVRLPDGALVARPVRRLSYLAVRVDARDASDGGGLFDGESGDGGVAQHQLAAALPAAAVGAAATVPVLVRTRGAGPGYLSVSYATAAPSVGMERPLGAATTTPLPRTPLFDFRYDLDATPVIVQPTVPDPRATAAAGPLPAHVACAVQLVNPLPVALRDVEVVLAEQEVRDHMPAAFEFRAASVGAEGGAAALRRRHPNGADRSGSDSSDSDNGGGGGEGGGSEVKVVCDGLWSDKDEFRYASIPLMACTEGCFHRIAPLHRRLPGRHTLPPGQLHIVPLPSLPVELTLAEFFIDYNAVALTVLHLRNMGAADGDIIEAGQWSITTSPGSAPIETRKAHLIPNECFTHCIASDSPVNVSCAISGYRVAEYVSGLLQNALRTHAHRVREVQVELHNKDHFRAKRVLLCSEYQTETHLQSTVKTRLFRKSESRDANSLQKAGEKQPRSATSEYIRDQLENDIEQLQIRSSADDILGSDNCGTSTEGNQREEERQPQNVSERAELEPASVRESEPVAEVSSSAQDGDLGTHSADRDVIAEEGKTGGEGVFLQAFDTCAELSGQMDEPRGFIQYSFDLAAGERAVVHAKQTFATEETYDLQTATPLGLLHRLSASADDRGVVPAIAPTPAPPPHSREQVRATTEQLAHINKLRGERNDASDALASMRAQVEMMRRRCLRLSVDFSDDEDGEAVDRYQADFARRQSRLNRLREIQAQADDNVAKANARLEDALRRLHDIIHPDM